MKDNFSNQSVQYAKYRPSYPAALFNYILSLVPDFKTAWDCGTGNGQIANVLADSFDTVYATDISENQLANAIKKDNIIYSCSPAEHTSITDKSISLITVGQAIHWFKFEQFYEEVNRTIIPGGILAVTGYGVNTIDDDTDPITHWFYKEIVGKYWDFERRYIEEEYRTIPFPFDEIHTPVFESVFEWTLNEYLGYLSTWSSVQHYIKANNEDPIVLVKEKLSAKWQEEERKVVRFPILLKVAKL